jgi:hypothetical protein
MKAIKLTLLISLIALMSGAALAVQKGAGKAKAKPSAARPQAPPRALTADGVPLMTVDELILKLAKKAPVLIIDVRNPDSYETKIKGAVQIPHEQIEARLKEIPPVKEIVTYCS